MSNPYAQMPPPWAWFMPPGFHQPQQQIYVPDIIVPARVNKALEFLSMLSQKTMTRAAGNDMTIEQIDGQKLTEEELNTQATACHLLSKYFSGDLTPDVWERIKVEGARRQVENGGMPGRLMPCVACAPGPAQTGCPLCHGSGKILVTAVGTTGPADDDQTQSD